MSCNIYTGPMLDFFKYKNLAIAHIPCRTVCLCDVEKFVSKRSFRRIGYK